MAIKAGQLIHVANQILVDRAQTAGPGTVNLNRQKVYELGNYLAVGSVTDIPDLSFSLESFDASAELEATLTGNVFNATNGVQTLTITGSPTGGTYDVTFAGQTTATGIAPNATAAAVQTALRALSSVPSGTLSVSGAAGGPYTVTFSGSLVSSGTVALLTTDASGLTGGSSPAVTVVGSDGIAMADGFAMHLNQSLPLDVASQFKTGQTASAPFDTLGGVAIPYLALESLSYRYGITNNAAQTATLKGDGLFYTPGSVYIDEFAGTNSANQAIALAHPVFPYNGDTVAGTKYALSVSLSTGERLSIGADYTEAATGSNADGTRSVTLTIIAAVPTTSKIKVTYASNAVKTYPQASHALATVTRPAAIRGRNITVCVGGVSLVDRWTSVQSVQLDYKVTLQRDEEFGNSALVGQDFDVPDVTGNIGLKPRDYTELYKKVCIIAGVPVNEVAGALTTDPLPLYIALHSPDSGAVLKSFYVSDARFNLPGFSGRVQNKLEVQFDWTSDTGDLTVYKGAKPGANG
jgi:hypothetical protein